MTAAADILNVAKSQIGYHEKPGSYTKFGAAYGMDGNAWCAMFQWWCFHQAGADSLIPKTAYTPTFYQWFVDKGQASHTPKVGDLVFFNWPGDNVNRIQHIGIVEAVPNSSMIQTIEGNTTQGVGGNQSDGGWVARRNRAMGSYVVGFGRPKYGEPHPSPLPAPAFDPNTLVTLQVGMTNNPHVANLQKWIHLYDFSPPVDVAVTGNYQDETVVAVKAAQARCGVTGPDANGETVGPRTKAAFAARGARW